MSGADWVAIAAMAQVVLLAWVAAWQARAAQQVRKINGHVEAALRAQSDRLERVAATVDSVDRDLEVVSPSTAAGLPSDPPG